MKKNLTGIIILCTFLLACTLPASGLETFMVKDIQYQSLNDRVRLEIIMNTQVECISYELTGPHRIVIDPLDEVYCDYQETVYFEEGLIKSIEFIKTKEKSETLGDLYYAFDFVAVELRDSASYEVLKEGSSILLDVNQPFADVPSFSFKQRLEKSFDETPEEKEPRAIEAPEKIEEKRTEYRAPTPREKEEDVRFKKEPREDYVEAAKREKDEREKRAAFAAKKEEKKPAKPKKKKEPEKTDKEEPPPVFDLTKELSLDECVEIAIDNTLRIKIAKEQVKLAKLKVNESFREIFPSLSFLWQESTGSINDTLYRGRKYGFEFKQPLFHGGELYLTWEQARINLEVAQENYNKIKEELTHDISKAYFELAKAMSHLDMQKELFEDIKGNLSLAEKEYELSLSTQLEFLNAQSLYDQTYYAIASAGNDVSLKRLALNKLMNIGIGTEIKIHYEMELKEFDVDIAECMELAIQHRPELKTKELITKSTRMGELIAQGQMWPQLDVVGKYVKAVEIFEPQAFGQSLDDTDNESFLGITFDVPLGGNTLGYVHKRGKLAPTVTTFESNTKYNIDEYRVNVLDGLERYTTVKNAHVIHQQALSDLRDMKQDIHAEVMEAFYSLKEAEIKLKGALNNLKLYEKELLATQLRKDLNEATVSELMEAKIKLFSEKSTVNKGIGDIYLAIASLNRAIGMGGYFK